MYLKDLVRYSKKRGCKPKRQQKSKPEPHNQRKQSTKKTLLFAVNAIRSFGSKTVDEHGLYNFSISIVAPDQPQTLYSKVVHRMTREVEMKAGRLFILFGNVTQVFLHSNGQSAFGLANIQHMTQSAAYHIDNVAAVARERTSDGERSLRPPDFGVIVQKRTGFTIDLGAGVSTRCNRCFTISPVP